MEGPSFESNGDITLGSYLFKHPTRPGQIATTPKSNRIQFDSEDIHHTHQLGERLLCLIDAVCKANTFLAGLVSQVCLSAPISDASLNLLEATIQCDDDIVTMFVRQIVTLVAYREDMSLGQLEEMLYILERPCLAITLRELLEGPVAEQALRCITGTVDQIKRQLDSERFWDEAKNDISTLQQIGRDHQWLLPNLDRTLSNFLTKLPPAEDIKMVKAIQLAAIDHRASRIGNLMSDHWKTNLLPEFNIDEPSWELIRALIDIWKKEPDGKCCELIFTIIQSSKFRPLSEYLAQVMDLSSTQVQIILSLENGNADERHKACMDLATELTPSIHPWVASLWIKPFYHIMRFESNMIFDYARSHLTVQEWFEFLQRLKMIYSAAPEVAL